MATDYRNNRGSFSNTDVDSIETVVEIPTHENTILWIEFLVGTADLTDFNVDFKAHRDGDYFTVASVAADYTSPEGPILGASSDLTVAAAGGTVHWLKLDIFALDMIRIQAAGTSSTITGYWRTGGYKVGAG